MSSRLIVFDPKTVVRLLAHYYQDHEADAKVPVDAEVRFAGFSKTLDRMVCLLVHSQNWERIDQPLHLRYEGHKNMHWGRRGTDAQWTDALESPKGKVK